MKDKVIKENWSWRRKNFSTHSIIINDNEYGGRMRRRARLLESVQEEMKYNLFSTGESGDNSITSIPFQVLSWRPRTLYFTNFLSSDQCQVLIDMAREQLTPSGLTLPRGFSKESTKGYRTSYGAFISAFEDKTGTLDFIEEKIARAAQLPRTHFEKFDAHVDAIRGVESGQRISHRIATFLMYLTDIEEGGETVFPFENGMNMDDMDNNVKEGIGLKIKPRKGDGILFYSLFPNGTVDMTSVHKSCPVIKGEKWSATKWIRDQDLT